MKKIYVSNLQKVLTETFLGDIDLTRLRHGSILSIFERGNPSQELRVNYANNNIL